MILLIDEWLIFNNNTAGFVLPEMIFHIFDNMILILNLVNIYVLAVKHLVSAYENPLFNNF
jgi:hypothetical protein